MMFVCCSVTLSHSPLLDSSLHCRVVTECLCFPAVEPLLVSVAPSTSHTPTSIVPTTASMCDCSAGQSREFPSSLLSHELCLGKPLK